MSVTILTNCSTFSSLVLHRYFLCLQLRQDIASGRLPCSLWLMPSWDLTRRRLNLGTMTQKSMPVMTSATSSLPPPRQKSWKRRVAELHKTHRLGLLTGRQWLCWVQMASLALARHLSILTGLTLPFVKLHLGLVKTTWVELSHWGISFYCLHDYNTRNCAHGFNCFHLLEKYTFPCDISLPCPSPLLHIHVRCNTCTPWHKHMYLFGVYYAFFCLLIVFITHICESQGDNEASGFESAMWVAVGPKGMNLQLVSLSTEDDFVSWGLLITSKYHVTLWERLTSVWKQMAFLSTSF